MNSFSFFFYQNCDIKSVRDGSQIWLQLSAASPTNRPQPKAIIVIIRLNLWPVAGCEAKVEAKLSPHPLVTFLLLTKKLFVKIYFN